MDKKQVLKKYFGFDEFREGQERLIDCILDGRDVLGIMPTGAGKSLCFQIPALMFPGITLVISPLISLMKDQVGALNQAGVRAAFLNSSLTPKQFERAISNAKDGMYKIIYIAPERLESKEFLKFVQSTEISLVAVDEAHCVSQWGQDFRPSYMKIPAFIKSLPTRPRLGAFTATATREVRADITRLLELDEPMTLITGFNRPKLYFAVDKQGDKYNTARAMVKKHSGAAGIIYCVTRKTVEDVCARLCSDGVLATRYHAGLSDEERRQNQDDFIYDRVHVMVATNAFGMGIDKSNVRYVIHYNMPKNLESYYQEAGRAGRDGAQAYCLLLYSGQDVAINKFLIEKSHENDELDAKTHRVILEREYERLRKMTLYCTTNECLRGFILNYFGENSLPFCGTCKNCDTVFQDVDVTEIANAVIGCIEESAVAYGAGLICDTLRGAKNERVLASKLPQNPYYGVLADIPNQRVRLVIEYLVMNRFLVREGTEYPTLRLSENKRPASPLIIKIARERKHMADAPELVVATEVDRGLFNRLSRLRADIALRENVPPYIVFSDKTIISMCRLLPTTRAELLKVQGVIELKASRYGDEFLKIIRGEKP